MALATVRGNAGKVTVGGTELYVSEWTMTKNPRLAEITNSGSAGFAQWKKTVVEGSGRIAGPWSSTATEIPDVLVGEGDEVALILYVGSATANRFYSFNAVIETLEVVCNQVNDVVRFSATFKSNGTITDPSA